MNFEKFLELVKFSEKISEEIKKSYFEKTFKIVNWKDEKDFATEVDEKMEIKIAEKIQKLFPDHGINGEESVKINLDAENIWYVDPIDGTKYFASGVPMFTSAFGLRKNGKAVAGIVINPVSGECIYGMEGFGSFKNGEKLEEIPSEKDLSKSFVYFDTTGVHGVSQIQQEKGLEFISELFKKTYRARNFGASCFASFGGITGHLSAFVDVFGKTKIQDITAFSAILQQIGYEERYFEIAGIKNYAIGDSDILDQIEEISENLGGNKFDNWNGLKQEIHFGEKKGPEFLKEGQVRMVSQGENIGYEASGKGDKFKRAVLILKINGTMILTASMTTQGNSNGFFYYDLDKSYFGKESRIVLSQIKSIDQKRFIEELGIISNKDLKNIKYKIKRSFI